MTQLLRDLPPFRLIDPLVRLGNNKLLHSAMWSGVHLPTFVADLRCRPRSARHVKSNVISVAVVEERRFCLKAINHARESGALARTNDPGLTLPQCVASQFPGAGCMQSCRNRVSSPSVFPLLDCSDAKTVKSSAIVSKDYRT